MTKIEAAQQGYAPMADTLPPAPLEDWYREQYFNAEIDISGSGVEDFSLGQLRELIGITNEALDAIVFNDSASLGEPKLRQALADKFGDGNAEKVMVANGGSEAIFLIVEALLGAGDEVVVIDPGYHSLVNIVGAKGCVVKRWSLEFDNDFNANIDTLAELISDKTKAVIVNLPHNPTGTSVSPQQQRRIIELAKQADAYLLWDASFTHLCYDEAPLPEVTTLYDKGISFGTFSKAFGLPGLRFGWAVAPQEVLQRCIILKDYTTLFLGPLVEYIALKVVENADVVIGNRLAQAKTNRKLLSDWIESQQGRVKWVLPRGGVTGFVQFDGVTDIVDFCTFLLDNYGLLLVPGTCFNREGYARVSFGNNTAKLQEGLKRLEAAHAEYCRSRQL